MGHAGDINVRIPKHCLIGFSEGVAHRMRVQPEPAVWKAGNDDIPSGLKQSPVAIRCEIRRGIKRNVTCEQRSTTYVASRNSSSINEDRTRIEEPDRRSSRIGICNPLALKVGKARSNNFSIVL